MTHPIDKDIIKEFAAQVDEIYVVEEKRPLLENEIKAFITHEYQNGDMDRYVNVWGKQFPNGIAGIPVTSGLDASILIQKLIPLFKHLFGNSSRQSAVSKRGDRGYKPLPRPLYRKPKAESRKPYNHLPHSKKSIWNISHVKRPSKNRHPNKTSTFRNGHLPFVRAVRIVILRASSLKLRNNS